jgi:hypothetical protein
VVPAVCVEQHADPRVRLALDLIRRLTQQPRDDGGGGRRQTVLVIAALQHDDGAAARRTRGDVEAALRERGESRSVTRIPASGSSRNGSKPAETSTSSGSKLRPISTTISR